MSINHKYMISTFAYGLTITVLVIIVSSYIKNMLDNQWILPLFVLSVGVMLLLQYIGIKRLAWYYFVKNVRT